MLIPKNKFKRTLLVLLLLLIAFFSYVQIVNLNSVHMTYRQKILKAVYPAFMWLSNLSHSGNRKASTEKKQAPVSFYSLSGVLNNGTTLDFSSLKGKKILLVNTASDCGYTRQYESLEKLFIQYKDKLVLIGFPANDFKGQEKGDDAEIATFCSLNYGVSFLLMKKSIVIKDPAQNEIFAWLSNASKNGWNNRAPSWNFCKYLVDENGNLTHFFASATDPMSKEITDAIDQ